MNTIIKPLVTEKSMSNVGKNKYTFMVGNRARKTAIKKAIEKLFSVHVIGISTVRIKGKSLRTGKRRVETKITPTKKAIIEIKEGEKIGLFEAAA